MKIYMQASGSELTPELEKYANIKISQLARKVPRRLRPRAVCRVQFKQTHKKKVYFNTCSISFALDGAELKAEETTLHMYAALDIAAVHIAHQLRDYAAKRGKNRVRSVLKRYFHR